MLTKEQALKNKERIQKETEGSWLKNGGYGCAELATGCGKTKVAISCIESIRHMYLGDKGFPSVLIVVPTEEMRDIDWPEEFNKWSVDMTNIKLICYATLNKEKLEKYDMIVYDECHRVTLPNLRKLEVLLQSPNKPYILGLTATLPKVAYPDDMERVHLLKELFPTIYKVSTDDAVELGLIADFVVNVLKFNLDSTNKNIKAGSKATPFTTTELAHYKYLTKKLQIASMAARADKRKEGFKFSAISARAQFLYNLPSKLRLANLCLEKITKSESRTIVFAGSIEQANTLCGDMVYHSESTRDALDKFQKKEISLLGAVKALNEGKNLTEPDNAIIVQVDSVERNLVQRIGRLVRIRYDNLQHKARIIILVAKDTADENWYTAAISDFDSKRITETLVRVPELKEES